MPKKLSPKGSEAVHLRMPPEQLAMIDRAAESDGLNRSAEIRELLDEGYQARIIDRLIASVEVERT